MKNIRTDYGASPFQLDNWVEKFGVFDPRNHKEMETFQRIIAGCEDAYYEDPYWGISRREDDPERYDFYKSQLPTLVSVLKLMDKLMDEGKL